MDIYNLVAASGIEDRIAGLVGDKRALFVGLFDGTSDEIPFDSAGSFMTRVQEIIRPVLPPTELEVETSEDAVDRPDENLEPEEAEVASAPEIVVDPAASTTRTIVEPGDLASLMSGIQIRPLADGRIALELPRSAATALGGLLRALAAAVEGPSVGT